MKYAFIINPIAGNGKKAEKLCKEIEAVSLDTEYDIEAIQSPSLTMKLWKLLLII